MVTSMNFKELCNGLFQSACVISVTKHKEQKEFRIVDGNDLYTNSFKSGMYAKSEFVPNSLYTEYLEKNLNFEEYSFRAAVNKELLHSYAYLENFKVWMHMLFIPLSYETDELSYCIYMMEINQTLNPDILANHGSDIYSRVLNTTLQLSNTIDFKTSLKNVTKEIRMICDALFSCILLINEEKRHLTVLAEDVEPNSFDQSAKHYLDDKFYDIVKSWDSLITNNGNCLIIKDDKDMDYIKEKNPVWFKSLEKGGVKSLALFMLKSGNDRIGYMWVSNFKESDTPKIKDALEITSFVLGSQIGNHLLLDKLTRLSSIDVLTGLYNRNRLNAYMNEILESEDTPTALIFSDINGLKKVNDKEGHIAGDNLIRRAAHTLISVFTENEIYRVGGDEFVVIMRDIKEEQVKQYIEKLRHKAMKNDVSIAVGYSMTNKSKDIEKLLKEADMNMYNDKRKFYLHVNKY